MKRVQDSHHAVHMNGKPKNKGKDRFCQVGNVLKITTIPSHWESRTKRKPHRKYKYRSLPDADTVILHAVFQVIVNFVEKEEPGKRVIWDSTDKDKEAWDILMRAYKYWKKDRFILQKEYDRALTTWAKTFKTTHTPNYDKDGKILTYTMGKKYLTSKKDSEAKWKKLHEIEDRNYNIQEKMLADIIRVRGCYWT